VFPDTCSSSRSGAMDLLRLRDTDGQEQLVGFGARIRAATRVQVDMSAVAGNPDKICSG
jgi:hypothetical protein